MKVLIAEDHTATQRVLKALLRQWGYEPDVAADGLEAWNFLQRRNPPMLGIIDWMMPGASGFDLIQMIQQRKEIPRPYIILLTSKNRKEDVVAGLNAGADDFLSKPFNADELWARIRAGIRTLDIRKKLEENVRRLDEALSRVKRLHGLLPICSICKKIRDGENYRQQVERYLKEHAGAQFTHGLCPDCQKEVLSAVDAGGDSPFTRCASPIHSKT